MARGRNKNHKSSRGRGSRGRGGRGRGSSTRGPQPQREDRGAFAKRSLVQHRPHDEVEDNEEPVGTASWAVYDGGRATVGSRDEYDAPPQSTSPIDFFALAARLASLDDATLLMVDTKRAEALLGKALVRPRGEKVVAVEEEKEVSRPETTVGGGGAARLQPHRVVAVVRAPPAPAPALPAPDAPLPAPAPAPALSLPPPSSSVTAGDLDALLAMPSGAAAAPTPAAPFDLDALLAM